MVDQLVGGHAFLKQKLGVRPTASWSVNDFGHSGTLSHCSPGALNEAPGR